MTPTDWPHEALRDLARALDDPDRRPWALHWLTSWWTSTPDAAVVLCVAADGAAFRVGDGPWRDLGRRHVLRRLLLALTRTRGPRSAADLLAAGWPGERIAPSAARNRLHVALCRLRRAGLGDLLEFDGRAWQVAERARVVTVGPEATSVLGPERRE
jgi:hypothetical protein